MTTSNPISELELALRDAVDAGLLETHTAIPGIIQAYDAATQTADVQIVVSRMTREDGTVQQIPILPNVPVVHPRSETAFIHMPIAPGDSVLIVFAERNIDDWRRNAKPGDAPDDRRHHYSDAIALVGMFPDTKPMVLDSGDATKLVIQSGDRKITLSDGGDILLGEVGGSGEEPAVLGSTIVTLLTNILDLLIAGNHVLVTSPGNPTAPNPTKVLDLQAWKSEFITTTATNILSGKVKIHR